MLLFRKSENQIFLFFKSGIETCAIFFRNRTFLFVIRSLRYSGYLTNTSNDKQKSFFPKKKMGALVFETLKNKKSDFLIFWIVTRVSTRDYMVCRINESELAGKFGRWSSSHHSNTTTLQYCVPLFLTPTI